MQLEVLQRKVSFWIGTTAQETFAELLAVFSSNYFMNSDQNNIKTINIYWEGWSQVL